MYLTGNPIGPDGSNDPRDLSDNAQIIDVIATDTSKMETPSRLGDPLTTVAGMKQMVIDYLAAQGFEAIHLQYVDGQPLTVLRPTQLIDRGAESYKVRQPASFPVTLSGNWASDSSRLVEVTEQALREALASESGTSMVGDSAGLLKVAMRRLLFGNGVSDVLQWGAGSITDRSQILLQDGTYYAYLGSLPRSLVGDFASQPPGLWLRLSENIYKSSPEAVRLEDLTGLIRSGVKVVITGDSLSFNAYGMGGNLSPSNYAYNNPYGLMSWGHMIRDSLYSCPAGFTLAKNAQIEFTNGVSRNPNVNPSYAAPFNNQLETFLVNSASDEIAIRMNGVFSGGACRLLFFTGNTAFANIASFDIYTNGVLRQSVDLRGGSSPYLGRYQIEVDGIPLGGASEVVLRNIKRADGAAGPAAVQFIGYSSWGPRVFMTGRGGWTSAQVLADFENMVGQHEPDLVFYQIGANDMAESTGVSPAQFRQNVESFITQTRALKPYCQIILLSTTSTSYSNLNNRYGRPGDYIDVLYELAVKYRCGFVDVWELFSGMNPAVWRIDAVHTTPVGGNILYQRVKDDFFPSLKVASGFIPDATYQVVPTVVSPAPRAQQLQLTFDSAGDPVLPAGANRYFSVSVGPAGLITISPVSGVKIEAADFLVAPPSHLLSAFFSAVSATSGVCTVTPVNMLASPPAALTAKSQLSGRTLIVDVGVELNR